MYKHDSNNLVLNICLIQCSIKSVTDVRTYIHTYIHKYIHTNVAQECNIELNDSTKTLGNYIQYD